MSHEAVSKATNKERATTREPEAREGGPTRSPRLILTLIVLTAVVVAAVLVVLSQSGGGGSASGGGHAGDPYSGIPQDGTTLGEKSAPVAVYLYEDFQCPFCGQFSRETFPELVTRYVRPGKVRVVSRPLTFLGPDSVEAAGAALAAGEQDRYWRYHSLLFENQGGENSGYVTDDFLTSLAEETPGLDVDRWNQRRNSYAFKPELRAAASDAQDAGANATPTLLIRGPEGERKLVGAKTFDQVAAAIDEVEGS